MDNFNEIVINQIKKINQLDEFVSLYFRKKEKISELRELTKKVDNLKPIVENCNKMMENYHEYMTKESKKLLDKMKSQQLILLKIIFEIKKLKKSNFKENIHPSLTPQSLKCKRGNEMTPITNPDFGAFGSNRRMYLSDYKVSPYVSKIRPIALQFIDFETVITPEMFETIPKYIRGRENLDELNTFLDQVITPCFTEKYRLFYKSPSCLKSVAEKDLWKLYKDQAYIFPGYRFITQGDISRKINRLIDKKMSLRLAMLRHLGILKEEKKQTTVYYLWIDKTN